MSAGRREFDGSGPDTDEDGNEAETFDDTDEDLDPVTEPGVRHGVSDYSAFYDDEEDE